MFAVTDVIARFEIATPVRTDSASRLPKFPESSAYTRAAFVFEVPAIAVSLTVTLFVFPLRTAATEGAPLPGDDEISIQPIQVGLLVPAVLKRRELRAGTEYVN